MKKLLIGLLFSICGVSHAITYQSVRMSTATVLTPPIQTGTANITSATIRNLNVPTSLNLFTAGALTTNGSAGTAGQILTSNGAGLAPTWQNVTTDISGTTVTWTAQQTFQRTITISSNVVDGAGLQGTAGQSLQTNAGSSPTWVNVPSAILGTASSWSAAQTFSSATVTNLAVSSMTTTLPMSGRKITGLANGTVATDVAAYGQIFQLSASSQSAVVVTSATTIGNYVPTGHQVTITPSSASSRVRISYSGVGFIAAANGINCLYTLFRDSTNLATDASVAFTRVRSAIAQTETSSLSIIFIDSPATTSGVVYSIRMKNDDGTTSCSVSNTQVLIAEEVR